MRTEARTISLDSYLLLAPQIFFRQQNFSFEVAGFQQEEGLETKDIITPQLCVSALLVFIVIRKDCFSLIKALHEGPKLQRDQCDHKISVFGLKMPVFFGGISQSFQGRSFCQRKAQPKVIMVIIKFCSILNTMLFKSKVTIEGMYLSDIFENVSRNVCVF